MISRIHSLIGMPASRAGSGRDFPNHTLFLNNAVNPSLNSINFSDWMSQHLLKNSYNPQLSDTYANINMLPSPQVTEVFEN